METKTPVVATNYIGPQKIKTHKKDGFLVNFDNKEEEYQKILKNIYEDNGIKNNVGEEAYRTTKNNYTVKIVSKELEELILRNIE